ARGGGTAGPGPRGGGERESGGQGGAGGARGGVLPRQAPPRPSALSTIRKPSMPAWSRATAMPSPPNPAPTTTTRYVESSGTGPPRAQRGPGQDAARVPGSARNLARAGYGNHPGRSPGAGAAAPARHDGYLPHSDRLSFHCATGTNDHGAAGTGHTWRHDMSESLSYRGVAAADRTR